MAQFIPIGLHESVAELIVPAYMLCAIKKICYIPTIYEYSDIVQVTFWIPIYTIIAKSHRNYVHEIYNIFYYVCIRYFLVAL